MNRRKWFLSRLSLLACFCGINGATATESNATVLLFNTGEGGLQAHGDFVVSTVQDGHSYLKGFGWTPDIAAEYGEGAQAIDFGGTSSAFGDLPDPVARTLSGRIDITLAAMEGWDVVIQSVNMAARDNGPDRQIDHIIVWDEGEDGASLFLESNGIAPSSGRRTIEFGDLARSSQLRLEVATGAAFSNVAIDALSFYQVPSGVSLGDANRDHVVDLSDFAVLRDNFGKAFASASWERGDFNSDRLVDLVDFGILRDHFGQRTSGNTQAVPEPSTIVMAFCAATFGIFSYSRQKRSCKRRFQIGERVGWPFVDDAEGEHARHDLRATRQ